MQYNQRRKSNNIKPTRVGVIYSKPEPKRDLSESIPQNPAVLAAVCEILKQRGFKQYQ